MVVKIPEQHYFPDFLKRGVLEKTGCNLPDWEISVPRKDDIAWSIILSYLISTDHRDRDRDDFSRRLFDLTGCNRNLKLVKNAIKTFNPFRNRFSCFYNKALQQVVTEFKENIGWNSLRRRISCKLIVVSRTLGCRILHIWKDKYAFRYNIYPKTSNKKLKTIFILSSDYTNEENQFTGCVCNFLLDHDMGIGLKFTSLRYFLKEAEIPRKILNKVVEHVAEDGDNFLISLLHSDYQDVISTLYSSAYLVSKLAEAGFETDPKTADSSGFSAFHHALDLGKIEILYKMYYFSANNYYQTEESDGISESCIVNNLQKLVEIFSNDLVKFDTLVHHPGYHRIKKKYNNLIRFNNFLLEINSNLLKIKSQLNYFDSIEDTVFEASKRRDIILCILDTYKIFFLSDPHESVMQSRLDDYIEFRNYYNSIDLATAIIFFSNIIYLKERLALENENTFSQMEISFYQTIYFKYFSGTTHCEEYLKKKLNSHTIFFLPLIRRLENLENINEFSTNLRDTIITEKNVIKYVPEREILSIFKSFPIFKNVIHLNRLKYYIETALKIKVVDEKSVLVIQRVLQVIGEYVNPNNNNISGDDDDFQRFISLILPKNVSHVLLCIRNKLSHLQSYELKLKFECEDNVFLFRSIQKEINSIYYSFNLVYNFYVWKESLELLKCTEQDRYIVRKLKNAIDNPDQLASTFNEVDFGRLRIETFILYRSSYVELFEIVLHSVDNKISDEIEWTGDWKKTKDDVLHVLWPLKKLFGVLSENDFITDSPLTNIVEALILAEKNMDLNILKRKFDKSIWECKDLLSRLENETPLRKRRTPLTDMKNTEYAVCSTLSCESDILKTITNEENIDLLNDLKDKTDEIIGKCFYFLLIVMKLRKSSSAPFPDIENTERFLKVLKGFTFLSSEQKDEIRKEIPENVKLDTEKAQKLIKSVHEGFSLNIEDGNAPELQISYLSKTKRNNIFYLYESRKRDEILSELESTNPIAELEEIFSKNSVDKKRCETMCEMMQFSEGTKTLLRKLVAGQIKKIPENNLRNLLNRIQLLKKILIEEKGEIHTLWLEVKRPTSKKHVVDKIIRHYLREPSLQAAVEMLLIDCMSIRGKKGWIKSSNLYCGINLRNILCHGNPFLDRLCELLAPDDLASELIKIMLRLIEGEDAIRAILKLYERLNGDYSSFQNIINSDDTEEHRDLKDRIFKCNEWKDYVLLLPSKRTPPANEK